MLPKKKKIICPRIVSIGSEDNKIENEDIKQDNNKLINIGLKIDLKDKEKRENEINICSDDIIYSTMINGNRKVIKLKNGELAVSSTNKIEFFKNLKITEKVIQAGIITDFAELENENICILKLQDIEIYERNENSDYKKIKVIQLNLIDNYYKINNISENSIALLSKEQQKKNFFTFLSYPDYKVKELDLLDNDYKGDMIQIDNLIIICFVLLGYFVIYFYNIMNASLESVKIKSYQTYKKSVKCLKISENKILISAAHVGIIFNVKSRQVETFIPDFKNIEILVNVGKYKIIGKNNIISQINFKTGRLFNKYKFNFETRQIKNKCNILNIIDVGNNKFCVPLIEVNEIYLFNYN